MCKHTLYTPGEEGVCFRGLHTDRCVDKNDLVSDWIVKMLQKSQKGQKGVSPEGVAPISPRQRLVVLDNAVGPATAQNRTFAEGFGMASVMGSL